MKKLSLIVFSLFVAVALDAQIKNLGAGGYYSFTSTISVNGTSETGMLYGNVYTPMFGGTVFYEAILSGVTHMWEASYLVGQLNSVQQGEYQLEDWNPSTFNSLKTASIYYYSGITFLSGRRLQIPVYLGVGANYNMADPIKGFTFNLAAKARVKFYFTDRIGIYAGVGWKGGLGTQKYSSDMKLGIRQKMLYAEAGITFSL